MTPKLLLELLVTGVVGLRIYSLQQFKVSSIGEKLFALYRLRFYSRWIGYLVLFYSTVVAFLVTGIGINSIILWGFALFDTIIIYQLILTLPPNLEEEKGEFSKFLASRLSNSGNIPPSEIEGYLEKPRSALLLYADELLLYFTAIFIIESVTPAG
ncbi:MAG: hypothetical protein ABGW77_01275 [Campylobacterales bacterium]